MAYTHFESPELRLDLQKPEDFKNVAEKLDQADLHRMAQYITELVKIDETSMTEWLGKAEGYLDKVVSDTNDAMPQNREQQGSNEDGQNASTEIMMSAAIQFTARLTGAILSEPDLVKASEPGGEGLADWMSSQLRTVDPDWVNDTDPLAFHMAITGLSWRKRWFDDHDQIFRTTWLPCKDVIINANAKSLNRVPRITHKIQKYPYEIIRSIEMKHWVDYEPRFDDIDPEDLQDFYEVDMGLDLDGDGQDEPYAVTISLEDISTVVKIAPRWSKKTVVDNDKYLIFRPTRRYYAYRMIPDPKGRFFPYGFGWLLERIQDAADRLLSSIEDTAKSSAENGGIAAIGGVGLPDKIELKGNRLTTVNTDGRPVSDVLSMFPDKQVSAGSVQVLDKILTLGDRLVGTLNMLENAPASMTATMARGIIDSGSQVTGAAHRRFIGEMTEEMRSFGQLADDLDQLPPNVDGSGPIAVSADATMATEMHRSATAQVYHDMLQMPMIFDPNETGLRFATTLRLPNPDKLIKLMPPPQISDSDKADIALKAGKNEIDKLRAKGDIILKIAQAIQALSQAGINAQNAQLVAIEVDKLNQAIAELQPNDAPTSPANGPGSAGSPQSVASPAGMGGSAPGPGGGGLPPWPSNGASPPRPSNGAGPTPQITIPPGSPVH
jgi:hypothetical protein